MKDYIRIRDKVKSMIKESRFIHSLGVAETARMLADRFSLDEEKALICGIYHDSYRYSTDESTIPLLLANGYKIEKEEEDDVMLLHGALASLYFERDTLLDVTQDMKDAVRFHTLGSPSMGKLGAIIYISDYIEPGRKHLEDSDRIRILEKETIEEMVLSIIEMQRPYFDKEGIKEARISSELYSFIKDGGKL